MSFPWFRFYSETVHDRKLAKVASMAGLSKCEAIGAWAILLALANESPGELRGWLFVAPGHPLAMSDLADAWDVDEARANEILGAFEAMGLIGQDQDPDGALAWVICAWDGRQFSSDSSTKRTRAYRERKRKAEAKERARQQAEAYARLEAEAVATGETSQKRHGDSPDPDTDTEPEAEYNDLDQAWEKLSQGLSCMMSQGGWGAFQQQAKPESLTDGHLVVSVPYEVSPRLAKIIERAVPIAGDLVSSASLTQRKGA